MKNSIRKRYIKIHLMFCIFALIITSVSYFLFFTSLPVYDTDVISSNKTEPHLKAIHTDLDHDGNTVQLTFSQSNDGAVFFGVVYTLNKQIQEQYNFYNRIIKSNTYHADLNND